jgi:hypothetical protein
MNKIIITIIITLMSYMAFGQTEVQDTIITDTDTISVVTSDTSDTTNVLKFQYRVSFSEVSNTFSSKDLRTPIFDIFRTEPIYNENLNQFVFISNEDVEQFELMSNFNQYHITYFRKIPIKLISNNN